LQEHLAFSTSIRQAIKEVTELSFEDFKNLSEAFQSKWRTLPEDDRLARPKVLESSPDKLALDRQGDDVDRERHAPKAQPNGSDDGISVRRKHDAITNVRNGAPRVNPKRSTERGEGRAKLIAALTKHHQYADGSCLNLEPIGNNELARLAEVDKATASAFFKKEFRGYILYRHACCDAVLLVASLKTLNGDFSPHHLYGRRPPGEEDRDDE
jgi:hypothetical protein